MKTPGLFGRLFVDIFVGDCSLRDRSPRQFCSKCDVGGRYVHWLPGWELLVCMQPRSPLLVSIQRCHGCTVFDSLSHGWIPADYPPMIRLASTHQFTNNLWKISTLASPGKSLNWNWKCPRWSESAYKGLSSPLVTQPSASTIPFWLEVLSTHFPVQGDDPQTFALVHSSADTLAPKIWPAVGAYLHVPVGWIKLLPAYLKTVWGLV